MNNSANISEAIFEHLYYLRFSNKYFYFRFSLFTIFFTCKIFVIFSLTICFLICFCLRLGNNCFTASNIYKKNFLSFFFLSSSLFLFFYFCSVLVRTSLFCTEKLFFPFETVSESLVLFQKCLCPIAATHFFLNLI